MDKVADCVTDNFTAFALVKFFFFNLLHKFLYFLSDIRPDRETLVQDILPALVTVELTEFLLIFSFFLDEVSFF